MSALPLQNDSILDKFDNSIPEEPRVISNDSYNPELEPSCDYDKPITKEDTQEDTIKPINIDQILKPINVDETFKPNNLDAEIQKLQEELDDLERSETCVQPHQAMNVIETVGNVNDNTIISQLAKKRSAMRTCCGVVTSVMVALLLLMLVVGFLVLETNFSLPLISSLRSMTEVITFRGALYDPMRNSITSYVSHVQNKIYGM